MGLKELRKEKNMTTQELSDLSGVNYRMILNYESGYKDINKAQGQTLYRMAEALGCQMEDLLDKEKIKE